MHRNESQKETSHVSDEQVLDEVVRNTMGSQSPEVATRVLGALVFEKVSVGVDPEAARLHSLGDFEFQERGGNVTRWGKSHVVNVIM